MSTLVVHGGKALRGTIEASSGKNAPIAVMCAALLIRGKSVLKNMTRVEEILRMIEIFSSIGVGCVWQDEKTLVIDASGPIAMEKINRRSCEVTRASLLLMGALAPRKLSYKLYHSGGCKLGERTILPHLLALKKLGLLIDTQETYYSVKTKRLHGSDIVMYESGDTATENAIMAAVLAPGTTTIKLASANYMVQDVCYFLQKAGAKIQGIGTTTLTITGVKTVLPVNEYYLSPDPVDAMAWISLAIATQSPLTITHCPLEFLELELEKLSVMGQTYRLLKKRLSKNGKLQIADIKIVPSQLHALPDKLYGRPFPGLNIDNVPLFLPILARARGKTLVHDWCYENRAVYYLELQKLGVNVLLLDPHRALVEGPAILHAGEINCPPAIRPGMAILITMLAAEGTSTLRQCYPILRAYDELLPRLKSIGADVQCLEE